MLDGTSRHHSRSRRTSALSADHRVSLLPRVVAYLSRALLWSEVIQLRCDGNRDGIDGKVRHREHTSEQQCSNWGQANRVKRWRVQELWEFDACRDSPATNTPISTDAPPRAEHPGARHHGRNGIPIGQGQIVGSVVTVRLQHHGAADRRDDVQATRTPLGPTSLEMDLL